MKAAIIRSVTVTKDAITMMKAGILIISGIILRNNDIIMLDATRTNVVAIPIPTPFVAEVVTASVGHAPKTNRNSGISSHNPLTKSPVTSLIFSHGTPGAGWTYVISEETISLSAIAELLPINL